MTPWMPRLAAAVRRGDEPTRKALEAQARRRGRAPQGRRSRSYEDWTRYEIEERAGEIGIEGRSQMTKDELIDALRSH